ncbi:MAG TPA: hypothetical protein VF598_03735, partial [Hymenobacter sp.]
MKSLCILGRQPALGLAELESLYSAAAVTPCGDSAALVDVPAPDLDFNRLGGSIKYGQVLEILDATDYRKIESALLKQLPAVAATLDGKVQLGLSVYGVRSTIQQLLATGLTLKKALRKQGRSVRLVPNKELALNSASIQHNNLTGASGIEILIVQDGQRSIIARTLASQDIDSYTMRDRGRPKRDARVGMLPPKLAQIIINLATSATAPGNDFTILDPFCGTGVVLQEGWLMGYDVLGTDLEQRMADYTITNMEWTTDKFPRSGFWGADKGDATNTDWDMRRTYAIACETYLGKPFTSLPPPDIMAQTISECNLIIKKFLRNIGTQVPIGTRLCLAVPAWQVR